MRKQNFVEKWEFLDRKRQTATLSRRRELPSRLLLLDFRACSQASTLMPSELTDLLFTPAESKTLPESCAGTARRQARDVARAGLPEGRTGRFRQGCQVRRANSLAASTQGAYNRRMDTILQTLQQRGIPLPKVRTVDQTRDFILKAIAHPIVIENGPRAALAFVSQLAKTNGDRELSEILDAYLENV